MTVTQALLSGIIQGLTEFFPVSSSGHLALFQAMLGMKEVMAFDIFLHFGTLISVVIFFRKDIIKLFTGDIKTLKFIIIASVPTFIIGILFKDVVESIFSSVRLVGAALIVTGLFLLVASFAAFRKRHAGGSKQLGALNSAMIGIAQGIAVIPGISRSGSTIGTALIAGLDDKTAIKFSFLLALPAILGANLLKVRHIYGNLVSVEAVPYIAGFIAAVLSGLAAIKLLYGILKNNLLYLFGIYCLLAGAAVIILVRV
jgi:undecaprenyl-diphosphatase